MSMICRGTQDDLARVLEIVASHPTHFVPAAYSLIESDYRQFPSYVWDEAGSVAGFIVWMSKALELELLWMAVHPQASGRGIGGQLVDAAIGEAQSQRVVLLKTASPDSQIPGTGFCGRAYRETIDFFIRRGFREACRLESYCGSQNHCVVLYRVLHDPAVAGIVERLGGGRRAGGVYRQAAGHRG